MSWTDERVELLKKMWIEGQSASQIAKELGGVTRNAVIGKVHRLGLSNRNGGEAGNGEGPAGAPRRRSAGRRPGAETGGRGAAGRARGGRGRKRRASRAAPIRPGADARAARSCPAGQPLPPQPSANEISPEALANVREVEKKARKLTLMELTERTCKWPIGDPATARLLVLRPAGRSRASSPPLIRRRRGLPADVEREELAYCEAHVGRGVPADVDRAPCAPRPPPLSSIPGRCGRDPSTAAS
jgi:GcrA cell cycle regulator